MSYVYLDVTTGDPVPRQYSTKLTVQGAPGLIPINRTVVAAV